MKTKNIELNRRNEMHKREEKRDKYKVHSPHIHLFWGLSLAVVLLFAGIGVVSAIDNYYVATWGSDDGEGTLNDPWQHPSYAAQLAQAGDTIYLMDGTWGNEHVVFANSGTEGNPITMTAYNGTPTLDGVDNTGTAFSLTDKSFITITNLKIIKYYYSITGGKTNINISNNYIDTSYRLERNVNNSIIHNNTVRTGSCGIVSRFGANNLTVSNNTILKTGWNGITFDSYVYNSNAVDNVVTGTGHNGMQMSFGTYECTFKDNEVYEIADNAYYITWDGYEPETKIHGGIIEDCVAHHIPSRGIATDGAVNFTARRFKSWNITSYDIDFLNSENCYAIDCELDPTSSSVRSSGSVNSNFINTLFSGSWVEGADLTTYYYLDVLVQDEIGKPVEGAAVSVSHPNVTIDWYGNGSEYRELQIKPINLHIIPRENTEGLLDPQPITTVYTGANGHTPLPSDSNNTFVIADRRIDAHGFPWYQHPVQTTNFNNWTITAEKDGVNATVSSINPDASWYRSDPNTYQNTVTIVLPTTIETGNISGTVKDTSNNPIQNATVSDGTRSVTTNVTGTYTITNVPAGTYTVTASKTGYQSASQSGVAVSEGATTTVNFVLTLSPPDTTPPAAVTNLATSNPTSNSITLSWTASGDDGNTGTASQYDIRYSTSLIDTDAKFNSATQCTGEPSPKVAGSAETFTVTGLSPNTTYYFALKTADEVPNWSNISNSPSATTLSLPIKGDLNSDGKVNSLDYSILVAKWFKTTDIENEDLNNDGKVNVRDLGIMMSNWKE